MTRALGCAEVDDGNAAGVDRPAGRSPRPRRRRSAACRRAGRRARSARRTCVRVELAEETADTCLAACNAVEQARWLARSLPARARLASAAPSSGAGQAARPSSSIAMANSRRPPSSGSLPRRRRPGRRGPAERAVATASRPRSTAPAAGQCASRKPRSESRSIVRSSAPGSVASTRSVVHACRLAEDALGAQPGELGRRGRASCSTSSVCSPRPATVGCAASGCRRHEVGHVGHLEAASPSE